MRLGVISHGCGNRFVQQRQIEVFNVHKLKLGVAALLCDLVNPLSHGLAVATRSGASNNNGNLQHRFLHCVCLLQGLSWNALLQEATEGSVDIQKYENPQHRHDESQRQTAREHQYVNEQNVD